MSFQGGPLSLIGSNVVSLGTGAASIAASQAAGNLWKGSGQTFFGQAGQGLVGGLAGSAVNIALNSAFSTSVVGPQGLSLDSGANFLASTITPQVTSAAAAGINQQIQQTLQKAGPFGTLLSTVGTGLVNQAFNGLTNSIFGASSAGTTENYKMFPGGGDDEATADYGGSAYTLSDVVFSLRRANQGPQSDGDAQAAEGSKTSTTVPADVATSSEAGAKAVYGPVNTLKVAEMDPREVVSSDGTYSFIPLELRRPDEIGTDASLTARGTGFGDPLGPLRGTKWDDLRPQTRGIPLW